jgi:hypothetical protein
VQLAAVQVAAVVEVEAERMIFLNREPPVAQGNAEAVVRLDDGRLREVDRLAQRLK